MIVLILQRWIGIVKYSQFACVIVGITAGKGFNKNRGFLQQDD